MTGLNFVFLSWLTCQSSEPRDILFILKDTLSIKDEKLFKSRKSVCSTCFPEPLQARYPHPKYENFNILSHFSH